MIYFQSFRQLANTDEVFVAMPMGDPAFEQMWTEVYKRVIKCIGLKPFRVDVPKTGDSILIEILRGIRRARLVVADISPDFKSGEYPNANVMYELGICHAIRLPETVIVVRSKRSHVPFDVTHIRALEYDPTDLGSARDSVRSYLESALTTGKLLSDELIDTAWSAMDPVCRDVVTREWYIASGRAAQDAKDRGEDYRHPHPGLFKYPIGDIQYMRWGRDQLGPAFARLAEFGLIEAGESEWKIVGREMPDALYSFTALGEVVADRFTSVLDQRRT